MELNPKLVMGVSVKLDDSVQHAQSDPVTPTDVTLRVVDSDGDLYFLESPEDVYFTVHLDDLSSKSTKLVQQPPISHAEWLEARNKFRAQRPR